MKCKYCGIELENGVLYCHNCGNAVQQSIQKILYCRECGSKLIPNSTFCSVCGAKVIDISSIIRHNQSNETPAFDETPISSENTSPAENTMNDYPIIDDGGKKGKKPNGSNKAIVFMLIAFLFLLPFIPRLLNIWKDKDANEALKKEDIKTVVGAIATSLKPTTSSTNTPEPTASPSPKPTIETTNTPEPTDIPSPTPTTIPTNTPKPTATPSPTRDPNVVSYSTNDKNKVRNGNSGIYSYRNRGGSYYIYYIIDFGEGYVYYFTDGNGSETCDRVKIESGDLNTVLIITYHDGDTKWSEGLHFKWSRQPDHLIHEGYDGFEIDLYPTSLEDALKLREKKTIHNY